MTRVLSKEAALTDVDWNERGEVLLVDKPVEWTSFDVVKKVRTLFGIRKIGHAGTLDPNASGLLILCTGPATKTISSFTDLEKAYVGRMELGIRTASFDMETDIIERKPAVHLSEEMIRAAVAKFEGRQNQMPPMYSAVKYAGRPLYRYARQGKTVVRESKVITVKEFTVVRHDGPFVTFIVRCSKGTYVRSLVSDVGEFLGCGAALESLRRTEIGPFHVDDAFSVQELVALRTSLASSSGLYDYRPQPSRSAV